MWTYYFNESHDIIQQLLWESLLGRIYYLLLLKWSISDPGSYLVVREAIHKLHNFLGFNINTTPFCLCRFSLHLLLLKSSMEIPVPMRPTAHIDLAGIWQLKIWNKIWRSWCHKQIFSSEIWIKCCKSHAYSQPFGVLHFRYAQLYTEIFYDICAWIRHGADIINKF